MCTTLRKSTPAALLTPPIRKPLQGALASLSALLECLCAAAGPEDALAARAGEELARSGAGVELEGILAAYRAALDAKSGGVVCDNTTARAAGVALAALAKCSAYRVQDGEALAKVLKAGAGSGGSGGEGRDAASATATATASAAPAVQAAAPPPFAKPPTAAKAALPPSQAPKPAQLSEAAEAALQALAQGVGASLWEGSGKHKRVTLALDAAGTVHVRSGEPGAPSAPSLSVFPLKGLQCLALGNPAGLKASLFSRSPAAARALVLEVPAGVGSALGHASSAFTLHLEFDSEAACRAVEIGVRARLPSLMVTPRAP